MPVQTGPLPVVDPYEPGPTIPPVPSVSTVESTRQPMPLWAAIVLSIFGAIAMAMTFAVALVACASSSDTSSSASAPAASAVATSAPVATTAPAVAPAATSAPTAAVNTAPTEPAAATVSYASEPLRLRGIGAIDFGMTIEEAERVTGGIIEPIDNTRVEGCVYAQFRGDTSGPMFMVFFEIGEFNTGLIVRADLLPGNATRSGISIGSSKAEVLAAYGDRIEVSPHKYTFAEGGEYLTFIPADAEDINYRVIMETLNDQVTEVRAGLVPAVGQVEGCL